MTMNIIDMRTVVFSYLVSNAICAAVMTSLWLQNRRRSAGLNFWLADFILQFLAVLLVALRGILPDLLTILLANLFAIGGTILLYIGLELYTGRRSSQVHNVFLLAVFMFIHAYFTYVQPSLQARNINVSLALLAICSQSAWLLLKRAPPEMQHDTKPAGMVFAVYSLVNLARVFVDWSVPYGNDFFQSGLFDTLVVLVYQMLFIVLTFGLFLMVNKHLLTALESDIAQRKATEEALKKSEEKFSKAFHNSPDAIVITSISDGKIIQVNEGFYRLAGFTQEEIAGKTTIELNLWDELTHRDQFVEALQKNGRVLNYETKFRKKTGELFDGFISGELIKLQELPCVLTIIHDISERKQAENELLRIQEHLEDTVAGRTTELNERMAEVELLNRALANVLEDFQAANRGLEKTTGQLEYANKELEAFAYSVSHDLRAPLRAMEGFSSSLLSSYHDRLDEQGRHYLDRIQQASQRMGQLINDLLNLSRITRSELIFKRVDLSALVRTITSELKTRDPERQVEFRVSEPLIVQGDAHLLRIALQNLLENAWKFSSTRLKAVIEVGQMTVAEYQMQDPDSALPFEISNGSAIYFVRDNGVGFDMTYAAKLFAPFQRLHAMHEFPGTGIGLAIVQRVVTRHGGRVWPQAQVEQGATFYFTLGGIS